MLKKFIAAAALALGGFGIAVTGASPAGAAVPQIQTVEHDSLCEVAHHWKKCGPVAETSEPVTITIRGFEV